MTESDRVLREGLKQVGYIVVDQLGKGKQATVHRLTRLEDGLQYAGKVYNFPPRRREKEEGIRAGASIEIDILSKLSGQEHMPQFENNYDITSDAIDIAVIITKLFDGVPLHPYYGSISLDLVDSMIIQFLRILITLKDFGIVHRDIKPENVLINRLTNYLNLIDFGLACEEKCLVVAGSASYVSPKLGKLYVTTLVGEIDQGVYQESDLYAVGVTLYRFINGYRTHPYATLPEERRTRFRVVDSTSEIKSDWKLPGVSIYGHTSEQINLMIQRMVEGGQTAGELLQEWTGSLP